MQDRPDLVELLDSVRHFIETEIVPTAPDPRLKFRARVAANVLAVAGRERAMESSLLAAELSRLERVLGRGPSPHAGDVRALVESLNAELASGIRSGSIHAVPGTAVWDHLRQTVIEKLQIANPAHLRRVGNEGKGA